MRSTSLNFRHWFKQSLMTLGLCLAFSAVAWAEEPVDLVKRVSEQVLAQLRAHHAELEANPNRIYNVAEQYIVPHVDFAEMGRWIAGRNAWAKSSEADQKVFIQAFKTLVVRSYATSLLEYRDQTLEFRPVNAAGKSRVQVQSFIKQEGRSPLRIDYRLILEGGQWFLYDIVIEGVSLLKGYQAQFSDLIRREGLNAATRRIQAHNQGRGGDSTQSRGSADEE